MKTQQCPQGHWHEGHSWHPYGPLVDESNHDRYCKGLQPQRNPSTHERLVALAELPQRLSSWLPEHTLLTIIEAKAKNLKEQLRTRDRKITKLSRENKNLRRWSDGQDRDIATLRATILDLCNGDMASAVRAIARNMPEDS